jgi:hypothetical protein
MSARSVNRFFSLLVLVALLLQPLAVVGKQVDKETGRQDVAAPAPETGLYRTTVTVDSPSRRARLAALGVTVLADAPGQVVVLATADQLEALARLRFAPRASDAADALIAHHAASQPGLAAAWGEMAQRIQTDKRMGIAAASLSAYPLASVAALSSIDDDADGLTNTQEAWWCTDPMNPDSDGDGVNDGDEVAALKAWMANELPGPPGSGKPFAGWPPQTTSAGNPGRTFACQDDDRDSVPDLAERWELGLNMNWESTDRDQFDDGQELFGTTNCPGSGSGCGYGALPPASNDPGIVLFPEMPSWVKAPGKHPLVAAFPMLNVDVVESSLKVETVTVVTTDHVISQGTEKSYSTAKTEGTSNSVANTQTWNDWEESYTTSGTIQPGFSFQSIDAPIIPPGSVACPPVQGPPIYMLAGALCTGAVSAVNFCADNTGSYSDGKCARGAKWLGGQVKSAGEAMQSDLRTAQAWLSDAFRTVKTQVVDTAGKTKDWIDNNLKLNSCSVGLPLGISCELLFQQAQSDPNAGIIERSGYGTGPADSVGGLQAHQLHNTTGSSIADLFSYYPMFYPSSAIISSQTQGKGRSWGGSQTNTHTAYEEHTITNGEAFSNGESWGTATAVNSAHAADLRFSYKITNAGLDFARKICDLSFNVYIGDDPDPAMTYDVGPDLGGDGCFHNFRPGEEVQRASRPLPLSLNQMRDIDLGGPLRVVMSRYVLSTEDYYTEDAVNRGVMVSIEDGAADGDEAIDSYLIPTWGSETVLDVLGRYFPHTTDADGMMVAIWTPEYRADTPAWCADPKVVGTGGQRTLWCKHALSTADWWNVYTNGMGDGSEGFQDTPASPGSVALFRFNQDSDLDGYSDRSELRLGTDPNDPASFPKPELIAGVHSARNGNNVVATLSLLNTGFYDAYGVEAVMIAPNDTISITNNTVGGSGRVRAQKQVIVGSRIAPQTPLPAAWLAAGHAKPAAGGYYTSTVDLTYTFTAADSGSVGAGTLRLNWSDGAGGSGVLNFGAGYLSPNLIDVSNGIKLGLLSGTLAAGESFTLAATTPRDTFQYTIAAGHENDFTPPVVLVSYNDPQGNHRFGIPPAAMSLGLPTDNLMAFSGQMLQEPGVEIVTTGAATAGANTTNLMVNNPTGTALTNARLFLEFVNISGTVTSEVPATTNLPPGPNVVPMNWDTAGFSPAYDPAQDYIVMAFLTDYQGNILDTAARPLSSFQEDPKPAFAMATADAAWDFGAAAQGTLLKRSFTFANTGALDLLTYVSAPAGLTVSQTGSRRVGMADMTTYEMALNTANLAVGPYDGTITIRTSDPDARERTVHVVGTVTAAPADTPVGAMQRPLDTAAPVSGTQGQWVEFTHTLQPDAPTLHPVKVYSQDYSKLWGMGKYATPFGQGTASYDMFGDGRDGDLVVGSGQTVTINTTRANVTASGTSASPANSNGFSVGDTVLFHQTQGTSNVGRWEFAQIATINSATNWTLARSLTYTYDNGNGRAQVIKVPQFRNVTVQGGGVLTVPVWDGWTGGILVLRANGDSAIYGSIDLNERGYTNGGGVVEPDQYGHQGEGTPGSGTWSTSANGNGGGGALQAFQGANGGGGGGNGDAGASGEGQPEHWGPGQGGAVAGSPDLVAMVFGGGGGAGGRSHSNAGAGGGRGGGIVVLSARRLSVSGSVLARGGKLQGICTGGGSGNEGGGGGGAGGSIKITAETASLGGSIMATGGACGDPSSGAGKRGGAGGSGRIRVEYCETPPSFSTNPPASVQKLNCYIVEQIESSLYDRARLNLPESGAHTYQVQYGRKLNWGGAANQVTSLRVPAGLFTSVTLQSLVSDLPSNAAFSLDVGDTGSDSWSGTVGNGGEYTSPNLAAFFNAYWATYGGAPTTGILDVPIRVTLDRAGQVLLTNLQVTPTGSKIRFIRLPIRPQGYSSVTASFTVSGGSGPLAVGVDVGGDGSVDWTYTGSPAYPASLTTGNLAAAVNAYLAGKPDPTDVPIRFTLSPFATLNLTGFTATPVGGADASIGDGDVIFGGGIVAAAVHESVTNTRIAPADHSRIRAVFVDGANPVEGDTITINATIHNGGTLDTGSLTAAFYATPTGGTAWYIGSAFVPSVPPSSPSSVSIPWHTLGFTGPVTITVMADPYNRVAELNETNNVATATVTIKTRPDLSIPSIALSDAEPVAGRPVTVTVTARNNGETAAGTQTTTLYNGNPYAGGTLLGNRSVTSIAGGGTRTATFTWTPAKPGAYRLFSRTDRTGVVAESDEGNNDAWLDVYVGFGAPVILDSGSIAADPVYTGTLGYGAVDTGLQDVRVTCAGHTDSTLRRDPSNRVGYRFDHLQPGRFYHLDIILYECDTLVRVQRVLVDEMLVGGPVSLGDQAEHRLSIRLDPALYRDHVINVAIVGEEGSDRGAVVASASLREIDYRYTDSGGPADPAYTAARGWGYLTEDNSVAIAGTLPYRSARVNQNGPELRYRFDRLNPAKRYQVAFTFWQATGNPRLQRVRVDGLDTPATVNLVAGTPMSATVRLSPAAYATDGSVVVSVVVLNAGAGATVNEISLEEETLLTELPCRVRETASLSLALGGVIVNGLAAPLGTVVTAHNPQGDIIGCYVVGTDGSPPGQYGFMPIYGEDPSASPPIPGMQEGQLVTFRVDGALATATPPFYWHNDTAEHWTDLVAVPLSGQSILLPQEWNLFSFRVAPPVPLLEAVLGSIAGKYDRVLGEAGFWSTDIPPQFRTLTELHAGRSYYLRLTVPSANLLIEGTSLAASTPISLHPQWNWVGYLPQTTLPVTVALSSIAGRYQRVLGTAGQFYDVRYPTFSTLKQMAPGQGYRIYATQAATLTYGAATAAVAPDLTPKTPLDQAGACRVTSTPNLTLLFGALTVNDRPALAGTIVEALTPRGEVAGCFVVETPGQYGFMAVFGEDPTAQPPIGGFRPAEPVRLRVNGLEVAAAEAIRWQDDLTPHQVDLAAKPFRHWLPLIAR